MYPMAGSRHIRTSRLTAARFAGLGETDSQFGFHDFASRVPRQGLDDFERFRMLVAGELLVEELAEIL
jgi:hypothetical protein